MNLKRDLNVVHSGIPTSALPLVGVEMLLDSHTLTVRFEVRGSQKSHVNSALPKASSQWGLWDWDVVELFVSVREDSTDYFEFQISPLGQFFELKIIEPRKVIDREFSSGAGFVHSVTATDDRSWTAEMRIDLNRLGWDGKSSSIKGNAFAILGEPQRRHY